MALQKVLWSPDTCACQLEFEYDNSIAPESRTFTGSQVIVACVFHADKVDAQSHFAAVLEENNRKNIVVGKISEIDGVIKPEEISYSFDANRDLVVDSKYLSAAEKSSFVSNLDKAADVTKLIDTSKIILG